MNEYRINELKNETWDFLSKNKGVLTQNDMLLLLLFNMVSRKLIEDDSMINDIDKEAMIKFQRAYYMTTPANFRTSELVSEMRAISTAYHIPEYLFDSFFDTRLTLKDWQEAFCQCREYINNLELEDKDYAVIASNLGWKTLQSSGLRAGISGSSEMFASVMDKLINIQHGNSVLDGTIGSALLLIEATKQKNVSIQGQDISINSLQIAAMMLILSGYKDFKLNEGDFTSTDFNRKFDTVIMDIPLGNKMANLNDKQTQIARTWKCSDKIPADCLFIANALEHMKDNGRCVINVTPSVLFSNNKIIEFRKNLIERKLVSAVISMPSLYYGTNVRTYMLVLENNHEDVLMVIGDNYINKGRRNDISWAKDGESALLSIISDRKNIRGISSVIHYDDFKNNDFSLTPERYIEVETDEEVRTIEEIDKDLDCCYRRLEELEAAKKKMKIFR